MTLGLAVCLLSPFRVYGDQLLCAGAVLGGCRLAPVQARRSLAPLFAEKHKVFDTLFPSAQKVAMVAPGRSLVAPEGPWRSFQGCLEMAPEALLGSCFQDSSSRFPSLGFLPKESSLKIPVPGFLPQDPTSRIPQGFLIQDFSSRVPPAGFLFQEPSFRIPPPGLLLWDSCSRIPP